jgi:cytochrome c oxidase cbb3-type subunit 3
MSGERHIDELSGTETTGHEWDGIKELNTPLPRWWLWTFYATILFSIGYVIVYPAIPLIDTATRGLWGWSSRADLRREMDAASAAQAEQRGRIATMDVKSILADENLRSFAVAAGASAFRVNCTTCHGSGAQGGPGYPNLNDDSWIWGGSIEQIYQTIAHGVRAADVPDTRNSEMPAFGRDGVLNATQIGEVAAFVRQLSGQETDAERAERGASVYAENCAACHGEKGEGNIEFGAPQLNDAIWLYGGEEAQIAAQVHAPRHGMMPAWAPRLGDTVVKELAVYVHSLGGGQ